MKTTGKLTELSSDEWKTALGIWSMVSLYTLWFFLFLKLGLSGISFDPLMFLGGQGRIIYTLPLEIIKVLALFLTVSVPIQAILLTYGYYLVDRVRQDDGVLVDKYEPNDLFTAFLAVLIEALICRVLILDCGLKISSTSLTWFWFLVIFQSLVWAIICMVNYDELEDRNMPRFLDQFIIGIMLAFVYLRAGFLVAVLARLIGDTIIGALQKRELGLHWREWLKFFVFCFLLVFIGFFWQGDLANLLPWLHGQLAPVLEWEVLDYLVAYVFFVALFGVLANIFAFDGGMKSDSLIKNLSEDFIIACLQIIFFSVLVVALFWYYPQAIRWAFGKVALEYQIQALITFSLLFVFVYEKGSGNYFARLIMINLPRCIISHAFLISLPGVVEARLFMLGLAIFYLINRLLFGESK